MSSTADLIMVARVAGSLIVVLVIVALAARTARRTQRRRSSTGMRVVDRTGLSRDASLAVVEVAGRSLVLGVTAHGVSVLTVLDADQLPAEQPGGADPTSRPAASTPAPAGDDASDDAFPVGHRGGAVDFAQVAALAERRLAGGAAGSGPHGGLGSTGAGRVILPPNVRLSDHPDLATALRAAGRVADAARRVPAQTGRGAADALRSTGSSHAGRTGGGTARSTDSRPASGSILDPATWRQGLEALRDLTTRRT